MSKSPGQKMKLLYLARILEEQTDETHPYTVRQMIAALARIGIEAERKSLYSDLEALRSFGMDIVTCKSKTYGYYVGNRPFELVELKLLVDAVQCSRFITPKKSGILIRKLENLTSKGLAVQLQRQVYLSNRVKTENEAIYYSVDMLHTAISAGRKASFKYYGYALDKSERFRRDGKTYIVNPSALTWDNEKYYLIAYEADAGRYYHYRVDRMAHVGVLEDQPAESAPKTPEFDLSRYTRSLFTMFAGEEELVEMEFDNSLIDVVIDRFGKEVSISRIHEDHFRIHAKVAASPPFLSWMVQFGSRAHIIGPQSIVDRMKALIRDAGSCYPDGASDR